MSKQPSVAQLRAQLEAAQCQADLDSVTIKTLQRRVQELSDQLMLRGAAPMNMQQLQAKQRDLTSKGVPCKIHNGHIVHLYTRALII